MQKPEIDSESFFRLIDSSIQGLKEYRLIASALELGVFEALKAPLSAAALAEKLGCDPALMPHFCEALYSLGLLDGFEERVFDEGGNEQKSPDVVYRVSGLSFTYLLESSPFSQQHYLAGSLRTVELWNRLPEIMKNGPEIFEKGTFFKEVVQSMAENARCGMLQETVKTVTEYVDFGKVKKLLDLGGGHGLYAIAFAQLNENLRAFVFDRLLLWKKQKSLLRGSGHQMWA